jgi:hypothetical protein
MGDPRSGFFTVAILTDSFVVCCLLQREQALLELSKKRESFPDLAPVLWHSYGTIAALMQEIISVYPMLSPPTLSPHASNRVCNALALLQCVASHSETKAKLMNGEWAPAIPHTPIPLYPSSLPDRAHPSFFPPPTV